MALEIVFVYQKKISKEPETRLKNEKGSIRNLGPETETLEYYYLSSNKS